MPNLRVLEKAKKQLEKDWKNILFQTSVVIVLFTISIAIRIYIREWFYANYDLSVSIQNALYYSYNNPEAYTWEIFPDAQTYYVKYLNAFKYEQWNPYLLDRGFPLSGYVYGPIFVYGLTIISVFIDIIFPGMTISQKTWLSVVSAPIIFDSITTVFIYLILRKKKDDRKRNIMNQVYSLLASIMFIFMPIVLFYNDTLYLNTYMFTTFTVISIYFLSREKHKQSAIFLTIAILTKLNALFLAPLWLVYVARNNFRKGVEYLIIGIITYVVLSLPWLVISPIRYFIQQLWPGGTENTHFGIDGDHILWSTTPFHAFLYRYQETGRTFWYNAAVLYKDANQMYLPLLIFVFICCCVMLLSAKKMRQDKINLFSYTAMFTIGSHIFLSRGNYKYYDSYFIPFVIIALACWGETLDIKIIKFSKRVSNLFLKNKDIDTVKKKKQKIESFFSKETTQVYMSLFSFFIFSCVFMWIFVLNIWIIFNVKWLHIFYTSLLALTMILLFNIEIHYALFDVNNYKDLKLFINEEYRTFTFTTKQTLEKKWSSRKRGKKSKINEEKLS